VWCDILLFCQILTDFQYSFQLRRPSISCVSVARHTGMSYPFVCSTPHTNTTPATSNHIKFICHKFSTQYNNSWIRIAFGWTDRR